MTVLNLLSASVAKNQHFRPCKKNYALDRKMIPPFRIVPTFSISMQSLGEIELRAPAVGAKIGVFCNVTLGLPAHWGHSSNKYCVMVYGSIFMRFSALFVNRLFFQVLYIVLIFVARKCHNIREIAVKTCEKSKNRRKRLCALLRIDSWEIWRKFHCSSLGPRMSMCTYIFSAWRYIALTAMSNFVQVVQKRLGMNKFVCIKSHTWGKFSKTTLGCYAPEWW